MAPTLQTASADEAVAERLLANKRTVREFYDLAFVQRRPADAAARCVAPAPRSQSPGHGSAQAHVAAVTGWLDSMPRLEVEVLRVVAEGDKVVVQSTFRPAPDERAMLVLDMFRLRDGKIVEHWDALQEIQDLTRQAPLKV